MSGPRLTRKLVLEAAQLTPDGAGGWTEVWAPLGFVWAEMRPAGGGEAGAEAATLSQMPYRVTVRAAPTGAPSRPKPGQRFVDGTRKFRILAVIESDPAGRFLTCLTEEEVAA